jgi:hypothetical protein
MSVTDTTSCADPTPPVTGTSTAVARFNWNAPNRVTAPTANISNYVLVSGNLLRRHCEAGTLVNDAVLAANVDSTTVSCSVNGIAQPDCTGTPTAITVAIVATLDSVGSAPYTYTLTAAFRQLNGRGAPLLVITTASLANGEIGDPYSAPLAGTGGVSPYTWSATGLPAGLSMSPTTGTISGTPTGASGSANVAVTLTDAVASSIVKNLSLTVLAAPTISTATLASGAVGSPYSAPLAGTGGTTPYIWSATGLPSGLSMSSTTGTISGTPNGAVATATVAVKLTDARGVVATKSLALDITGPLTIVTIQFPGADLNVPYNATVTASGGSQPYVWSASGLPSALTMSPSGVVTGTPGAVAGNADVVVTLTDAQGVVVTKTIKIFTSAAPTITTASLPGGEKTVVYAGTTLVGAAGTTPYTWSQTGLPAGLVMSSAGVISGTPNGTPGTATVVVTLTDAANGTVSKSLSLVVAPQPTIVSVTLANVSGGTAGRIEKGDSIAIVYSAQMRVSSFCSTWATDTADQTLTVSNDVTVTLNDGANPTHDSVSVTSATCTFNFGLLDLGVSTYVGSGSASFSGSGANKSSITWTASTKTLLIVFGTKGAAGTVATVATSTPILSSPAAVVDSAGANLTNQSFTLPAGIKF